MICCFRLGLDSSTKEKRRQDADATDSHVYLVSTIGQGYVPVKGATRDFYWWAMRSSSCWRARWSREARGRERKRLILRSRWTKASRKAWWIWPGVPLTAAGSGMPQWAGLGWPGQMGQTSPAALSQTVKTKSRRGAPGLANSSQGLLRRPAVGKDAASRRRRAAGWTAPLGWLPAL